MIELLDLLARSSVPLAQHRWATAVAKDYASRLPLEVLAELLNHKKICAVKRCGPDHCLSLFVSSMQLLKVSEDQNGTWVGLTTCCAPWMPRLRSATSQPACMETYSV